MDHGHPRVLAAEIPEVTRAASDQVVDFARGLRPAEPASHDHETQMPVAAFLVRANLRSLHRFHYMRTQVGRVSNRFERKRMVGHARDYAEVSDTPASDY